MKKIDLAVFDLAGTTVKDNQDVQRVLQQAFAKFDFTISMDQASDVMGIPKPIAIRQLLTQLGIAEPTENQIVDIYETFHRSMIDFYENDPSVSEKEGVSETFRILKENEITVVVDTGFDRAITNVLLERLSWLKEGLVAHSITSNEVLRGRPFPDMIYKAMELTGVTDAARVAKVGDTASDLQEGSSAGCGLVIGVTSGAFTREALQREEHTHLIGQIPEILSILSFAATPKLT